MFLSLYLVHQDKEGQQGRLLYPPADSDGSGAGKENRIIYTHPLGLHDMS